MKVVKKLLSELLIENSKHINDVILHIQYDKVDERNHKSQEKISHLMGEAGFHEMEKAIEENGSYLYVKDEKYALHAHNFLNEHSAAVSSSIYYKGFYGTQAEEFLLAQIVNKISN